MELLSLVITARMIINVRWCLNIATRNCFYEHIVQANHLLCPLFLVDTNSKSRAGIVLNNRISFFGQNQKKKGFACLCLIRSVLHNSKASSVCLWGCKGQGWVQKFTNEGLEAQENVRLPCLALLRVFSPPWPPRANKGTFCSSKPCSPHTKYAHRQRRRAVPPSARSQAFLPSLWAHRGFILPCWAAALQCSELRLVLGARAELQCTNHLLGLEQLSGPACLQLRAGILCEASSFGVFAVPLAGKP